MANSAVVFGLPDILGESAEGGWPPAVQFLSEAAGQISII